MTVQEMSDAVLMKLDKSSSFAVAAFEPEDVVYWLNVSQDSLLKSKVFGNGTNPLGYGEGLKRMQDISPLVEYSNKLDYGSELIDHAYHPNVAYVNIATHIPDFLYYVGSDVLISDPNAPTTTQPQESELVPESVIGKLISTPYNKPALRQCYIYLKEGEVNVIYDPFATLDSIYISYVRQPGTLVLTSPSAGEVTESEMPEYTHDEIVNLAVSYMLENIESERFQSNMITLNPVN